MSKMITKPGYLLADGATSPSGMKIWAIAPNVSGAGVADYKHYRRSTPVTTGPGRSAVTEEVTGDPRNLIAVGVLGGLVPIGEAGEEWAEDVVAQNGSLIVYFYAE